jgi:hypothetical protein
MIIFITLVPDRHPGTPEQPEAGAGAQAVPGPHELRVLAPGLAATTCQHDPRRPVHPGRGTCSGACV